MINFNTQNLLFTFVAPLTGSRILYSCLTLSSGIWIDKPMYPSVRAAKNFVINLPVGTLEHLDQISLCSYPFMTIFNSLNWIFEGIRAVTN